MVVQKDMLFGTIIAYFILLLCGTLFFTPEIFVSRYITPPQLWLQCCLGFGLLMFVLFKKENIEFPPLGYMALILLWAGFHLVRTNWNFENMIGFLTVITAFLLFYWYWKEVHRQQVPFVVFTCLGLILSIWGLAQYMGLFPKTYGVFIMTGPFNNPAGISASLALLYPFSLYFCSESKYKTRWSIILASIIIASTVILCGARAAILAIAISTVIFIIYLFKKKFKISFSIPHYAAIVVTFAILFAGMYFIKKDSADGRLLVWHCSGQLVKQAPLFGHGNNGFKSLYMTEQANYFVSHPDSKYAMLADNTSHPFNEYLKEVIEYGIVGFLLSAILVMLPLCQSRKKHTLETVIVRLSLLSIGICSFFSYPLYYPFIRVMVVILVAYLVTESEGQARYCFRNNYPAKTAIGAISIFLLVITVHQAYIERKWKTIAKNSLSGFTEEMLPEYRELYSCSYLKNNALFLNNYAAELNISGYYDKSNLILLECCGYLNDIEVQLLQASNFENLNDPVSASQSLILANRMVPVRFFPLYRLAKLYEKGNEYEMACEVAGRIIQKEIKIPSMKITVMKSEMEEIIAKYQ